MVFDVDGLTVGVVEVEGPENSGTKIGPIRMGPFLLDLFPSPKGDAWMDVRFRASGVKGVKFLRLTLGECVT